MFRIGLIASLFALLGQSQGAVVLTLKEDQPLRLSLNLLFYYFTRSEPNYKSQRIKLLDIIVACNELNVKCSKLDINNNFFLGGDFTDCILLKVNF